MKRLKKLLLAVLLLPVLLLAGWGIGRTEDGAWWFYTDTSAPFPDNIEGH